MDSRGLSIDEKSRARGREVDVRVDRESEADFVRSFEAEVDWQMLWFLPKVNVNVNING